MKESFLDRLVGSIKKEAGVSAEKFKETVRKTAQREKLRMQRNRQHEAIKLIYQELGKEVFKAVEAGELKGFEDHLELLLLLGKIQENRKKLKKLDEALDEARK